MSAGSQTRGPSAAAFLGCICRELDWKWCSWDLNQCQNRILVVALLGKSQCQLPLFAPLFKNYFKKQAVAFKFHLFGQVVFLPITWYYRMCSAYKFYLRMTQRLSRCIDLVVESGETMEDGIFSSIFIKWSACFQEALWLCFVTDPWLEIIAT